MKRKHSANTISAFVITGIAFLAMPVPHAAAVDLVISSDPIETGSGKTLEARFSNVATVDGVSVDLHGKVLSQTSNKNNKFRREGDDFKFQIQDGKPGESRSATVRWTFYESGTNTPAIVKGLALTIDDLDDYGGRTESFNTSSALSYTVNNPTTVVTSFTGGVLTATGGAKHNSGDPESAITMYVAPGSSFVVTYRADFYWDGNAGFIHDGNGDFNFSNPEYRIFYTYHFTNDKINPVTVAFSDTLPAGLLWDKNFVPRVTGDLSGTAVEYSKGDSKASITNLVLLPGGGSITLCTQGTSISATILNEAMIEPNGTDANGSNLAASAIITIPN